MDEEAAVQVYVRLSDDATSSAGERARLVELQKELEAMVEQAAVGELEGDEWGGGFCCICLYGPNVDRSAQRSWRTGNEGDDCMTVRGEYATRLLSRVPQVCVSK
jgi:hypothetical protein